MKKIYITPLLQRSDLYTGKYTKILDPQDTKSVVEEFSNEKNSKIEVWGLTHSNTVNSGTILRVNDHINCTGRNPLRNHLYLFDITFPDLSNIYRQTKDGFITTGLGSKYPSLKNESLPTEYFCYYGIIAGAMGMQPIYGKLING